MAIALLERGGHAPWWAPLLKFGFMLAYVLLAPFVGPLADTFAKGRVMAAMNGVKIAGVLLLLAGAHPVAALAVVGLGAAAYAPAKYGLVTELVAPQRLVAANGWLEVTVVGAALLGAVLGGALVSPMWGDAVAALAAALPSGLGTLASPDRALGATLDAAVDTALDAALVALLLVYALSSAFNLRVPASGARYARSPLHARLLLRRFTRANRCLWRDADGGLSLAATTIFWGVGATLQFAVLRWAIDVLGLTLDRAAYLQAVVAVGVALGAWVAGRFVPLASARRMLPMGVALGLMLPLVASVDTLALAVPLLALAGALGGLMVVPLNALLQHRGHTLLSAGQSIAVQGFNENLSVLVMLAAYAAAQAAGAGIVATLWGLGLAMAGSIALLAWRAARRRG